MCGISGGINISKEALITSCDRLRHRGPDDSGIFEYGSLRLGHTRLAVVDLEGGNQPMSDSLGNCVVFNGEIYNYRFLRAELLRLGYKFQSNSDTEVLLHGFREWGAELPGKIDGMFAFAIFSSKDETLFLARDRFGEKPLYYSKEGDSFCFSSELVSLLDLKPGSSEIDVNSLHQYLFFGYVPAPRTLWKGLTKLQAGHSLLFDCRTGILKESNYWSFSDSLFSEKRIPVSPKEYFELLRETVRERLMSDVPLGIFLSGGLDSSAIAAACRTIDQDRVFKSFSIGFESPSFDESRWAALVAQHLGMEHHQLILSPGSLGQIGDEILPSISDPIADPSLLPTFALSKFARQHVTVALSGDGGDELLAGYDPVKAIRMSRLLRRLPPFAYENLEGLTRLLPRSNKNISMDFKARQFARGLRVSPVEEVACWMSLLEVDLIGRLTGTPCDLEDVFARTTESLACSSSDIRQQQAFFIEKYLQNGILPKVDSTTMLNSLESRAPFLGQQLSEVSNYLPDVQKFHRGETKLILREALKPYLPSEILNRKKKGFGIPLRPVLLSMRSSWEESSASPLDSSVVEVMEKSFQAGDRSIDPRAIFAIRALNASVNGCQIE